MSKMSRKDTTQWLSELLKQRLSGMGKHYASEVTLDMGTRKVKRVDFMQFKPAGGTYISDIEKGEFICYEVKSCIEDVYSGHGLNFIGEQNYIVTTLECYKKLLFDMQHDTEGNENLQNNKFYRWYYKDKPIDVQDDFGVMIAIPESATATDYFHNPEKYEGYEGRWKLAVAKNDYKRSRKRSTVELLFCMVRSGK